MIVSFGFNNFSEIMKAPLKTIPFDLFQFRRINDFLICFVLFYSIANCVFLVLFFTITKFRTKSKYVVLLILQYVLFISSLLGLLRYLKHKMTLN